MNWKKEREREAEECLDRWRKDHEVDEDFDMETVDPDDVRVTKYDMELMSAITALEEVMTCGDPACEHVDCRISMTAVKHLIDYSYLRRSVRAHRASKVSGAPTIADRRLWDLVEDR